VLEVMYLCVRGIDFASFYDFDILFLNLFVGSDRWWCVAIAILTLAVFKYYNANLY
jgi:hypothetical protein